MKKFRTLIITVSLIIFWSVLSSLGVFQKFENRFSDMLLGLKKAPKETPELLLVESDNLSLENVGPWPWKRDVYANMLMRMKELGASTAIFDVEFLSPSNFPECDEYFAKALQFFGNSFLTINTSDLDMEYDSQDLEYTYNRFLLETEGDKKLISEGNNKSRYETQKNTILGYNKIDWNNPENKYKFSIGYSPALHLFISHAKNAGFANTVIDPDGIRRRVELLNYQSACDKSVGQVALVPLMDRLTPEKIIRQKKNIILKNCHRDGKTFDIKIPLDEYGRLVINWTHNKFEKAFRHESIAFLDMFDKAENNIYSILAKMLELYSSLDGITTAKDDEAFVSVPYELWNNYNDITDYKNFLLSLCEGYDENSQPINGGIPSESYDEYFALRKTFFENVTGFASGSACDTIQEILFNARDKIGEEQYASLAESFGDLFDILSSEIALYNDLFQDKSKVYKDAVCIIGSTASSTTDIGTTPFERAYYNVGTHANVYNTIINQDFVKSINGIWAIIFIAILLILQEEFTKDKKALLQNVCGISTILLSVLFPVLMMSVFGIYVPAFTSILIAFTCYLAITIIRFTSAEKDKKFLKSTFGAYVAPAVVDQIVKHPELANLGGKSEYLTALFSDVKTFSGFTEVINNEAGEDKGAEKLVEILNEYLGVLSDAIMESGGTIDKYVGDEIVSFFGAPIPIENNAFSACVAAIRMLQAEKEFNEKNKDRLPINPRTGEPFWLRSRVGLNTGNMVVGNMGTEKKLNYTIMGNNVNLASRLEGTNKVYGSWIMVSESTWQMANEGANAGKLVARKFDCVRVVNVKKPVGIYNILGLRDEMSMEQIEACEAFNEGIEWYLKGSDTPDVPKKISELKKAYVCFKKADKLYPVDESSKVFMARCAQYIKNGVPEIWDGVYTMQSK